MTTVRDQRIFKKLFFFVLSSNLETKHASHDSVKGKG